MCFMGFYEIFACLIKSYDYSRGMNRREAYIVLNLLPDIGPMRTQMLLSAFGDNPCAALEAPVEELVRLPHFGRRCAETIHGWRQLCDLGRELHLAEQAGVYIITMEDECYPVALREIHDPPICLYVRGDLSALHASAQSIAMVGSRMTTHYALGMANTLATEAARAGWAVVSGLARGIDTCAHTATMAAGGRTLAVLGSGFNYIYPPENTELANRIAASGGALVSEFPINVRPDRRNFPMRNRIIAGISRGTLVVQAGLNSGSLITAAQALEQGRAVFAVPGNADTPYFKGCHALIRDGARLVECFNDVLDEFSLLPSMDDRRLQQKTAAAEASTADVEVTPAEYRVWSQMSDESPVFIDELLRQLDDMAPSVVLGTLLTLEIKQLIRQLPGKQAQRNPRRNAHLPVSSTADG